MQEESTCKNYLQVQKEGKREVQREVKIYNLQMILAIGYRVKNNIGMHFRTSSFAVSIMMG
ncbi:virulence RhuM family protein [Dorea acetigenes]|uniref:Virulence RhuM family protein n=1 Tax=Dorea acetigenes TaxID=2981787 RepID=A0ABT2RPJ7_9FIRM|nr:virulence RhuM family protein [Dorea acetigenes]MCU6687341.1 virulence RhuM family protein [Dorea acetigenes]